MAMKDVKIFSNTLTKSELKKVQKKIEKWLNSGMDGDEIMYNLSINKICEDSTVMVKQLDSNQFEIRIMER